METPGLLSQITRWIVRWASRPYTVRFRSRFGERPNDRDRAERFGRSHLLPVFRQGREVVFDLSGTKLITQAFFHALLAEAIREDPRWAGRVRLMNANSRQAAAFELSVRLLLKTHAADARVPVRMPAAPSAIQGTS